MLVGVIRQDPLLGEHSLDVLAHDLGLTAAEIDELKAAQAI